MKISPRTYVQQPVITWWANTIHIKIGQSLSSKSIHSKVLIFIFTIHLVGY